MRSSGLKLGGAHPPQKHGGGPLVSNSLLFAINKQYFYGTTAQIVLAYGIWCITTSRLTSSVYLFYLYFHEFLSLLVLFIDVWVVSGLHKWKTNHACCINELLQFYRAATMQVDIFT